MNIKDAILHRKSVRHYQAKEVSDDTLIDIIKTAEKSPSWINAQPGQVYIAKGNALKQIRQHHVKMNQDPEVHGNAEIPFVPIKDFDQRAQNNINQKRAEEAEVMQGHTEERTDTSNQLFYAPAIAYLTLPSNYNEWELYDLGAFGQTIMLAAQAHGVDSIPAFEFIKYPKELHRVLNIPDDQKLVIGIGLGYEDTSAHVNNINPKRMDIKDVLKIIK